MTLEDALNDLIDAYSKKDQKAIEKAYRFLEKVGMDRYTARIAASDLLKERKAKEEAQRDGQR